jgi:acyl-homoserine-lactone acylase
MIIGNPSVTFDQLVGYKHNTGMEAADRFLDDLLEAVEMYPDPLAIEAAEVLSSWDRLTETDSKGAILFARWWDKLNGKMFENPWDKNDPNNTPSGIKEKEKAVELLITAAKEVKEIYGKLDIPWGEVYRYRVNDIDYPANGGPGDYGIFRTMYFMDDKDNTKRAIAGETFIAVVEFDEKVKAKVLLGYGNATQKGNPHVGDQLEMLSEKKLRTALLERAEILKNLEKQEILKIE